MKELISKVESLIEKSVNSIDSTDALAYSLAALNAANALRSIQDAGNIEKDQSLRDSLKSLRVAVDKDRN